jgi:hypothetical protein
MILKKKVKEKNNEVKNVEKGQKELSKFDRRWVFCAIGL